MLRIVRQAKAIIFEVFGSDLVGGVDALPTRVVAFGTDAEGHDVMATSQGDRERKSDIAEADDRNLLAYCREPARPDKVPSTTRRGRAAKAVVDGCAEPFVRDRSNRDLRHAGCVGDVEQVEQA